MPKIELPPKVKCWRCGGRCFVFVSEEPGGDMGQYKDCDCDDGERYLFDDLAEKVVAVRAEIGEPEKYSPPQEWVITITYIKDTFYGYGPSPTTALLNAIEKFNEEL